MYLKFINQTHSNQVPIRLYIIRYTVVSAPQHGSHRNPIHYKNYTVWSYTLWVGRLYHPNHIQGCFMACCSGNYQNQSQDIRYTLARCSGSYLNHSQDAFWLGGRVTTQIPVRVHTRVYLPYFYDPLEEWFSVMKSWIQSNRKVD